MTDWVTQAISLATAGGVLLTGFAALRNGKGIQKVHTLVNSQLSDSEDRRDVAEKENVQLRQEAHDNKQDDKPQAQPQEQP